MPSLGIVPGAERTTDDRLIHGSPGRWVDKRATNECAFPPLDIGVQAIQLSPYRSGVAGPPHTRLLRSPAFQPCACPLALSGPGQAVASESFTLNSGLLWRQFTPCVTWRTLSPHTAHDRGILRERSISPAPRCIPHGQLCAFAGYLCTVSLPSPSGPSPSVLILVYPAFLGSDYYALFDCLEGLGAFGAGLPCLLPTLLHIPSRLSRVQRGGLQQDAVGGVLLGVPSALCGSSVVLGGKTGGPPGLWCTTCGWSPQGYSSVR